jgi:hypothetical protein
LLGSIFESGAVDYPTLLGVPIVACAVVGWRRLGRRASGSLAAVVAALVLLDFAFDDERMDDIAFFVVIGLFLFGLGALARFLTGRFAPAPAPN